MYFVGDGYEILAAEAWEANAWHRKNELMKLNPDVTLVIYQADPNALARNERGALVWENPRERLAALREGYTLLTKQEARKRH